MTIYPSELIDDEFDDEQLPIKMFDGFGEIKNNASTKATLRNNRTYHTMHTKTHDEKDQRSDSNKINQMSTTRPNSTQNMFIKV